MRLYFCLHIQLSMSITHTKLGSDLWSLLWEMDISILHPMFAASRRFSQQYQLKQKFKWKIQALKFYKKIQMLFFHVHMSNVSLRMYKLISNFIQGGIYPRFIENSEKQSFFIYFQNFCPKKSVLKRHFESLTSIILLPMIREIKMICIKSGCPHRNYKNIKTLSCCLFRNSVKI